MKKDKGLLGLFLAVMVFLPGCMRVPGYTPRSLQLFKNGFAHTQTEQGVTLRVKQFSCAEKYYFFDGRTTSLDDVEIIYLSVHNLSNKRYIISPDGINIPQLSYHDINKAIRKTSSVSRFSGAAVSSGVVALPFIIVSMELFPPGTPGVVLLPFLGAAIVAIPLGVAFLVQGIKSLVMNHRISKDLKEKMLHNKVVIKSGGHYEGLVFVKSSEYRPDFAVRMHKKHKAKEGITFDVDLSQNKLAIE